MNVLAMIKTMHKIKKNNVFCRSLFLVSLLMVFILNSSQTSIDNSTSKYNIRTVVIDAGHGGKDDGATGPTGKKEKNLALAVALKLGTYISENYPNVRVIYTRKTDVFVELYERAAIANRNKADLFISIHLNSSTDPLACGSEAWVLGLHRSESNLDVAKRENSVIKLEDQFENNYEFDPNSEAGHIIMSMAQNAYLDQSITLAANVEDEFETKVKRKNRGVKQAGFMVLYKTAMPATLIELGFISNPDEEKFLANPEGQNLMAAAIFNAFKSYKERLYGQLKGKPIDNSNPTENLKEVEKPQEVTNTKVAENTPVETKKEINPTPTEIKKVEPQKNNPVNNSVNTEGVIFRIQFYAANTKATKGSRYERDFASDIIYEDNGKGVLRYMIGAFTTEESASAKLREIKAKGYTDAFIVPYKNGKRDNINNYLK
jgi:N-acetylmuramoyl-L-alanine amidase